MDMTSELDVLGIHWVASSGSDTFSSIHHAASVKMYLRCHLQMPLKLSPEQRYTPPGRPTSRLSIRVHVAMKRMSASIGVSACILVVGAMANRGSGNGSGGTGRSFVLHKKALVCLSE
jgi:hypothetical protein